MNRELLVYADWERLSSGPRFMGTLRSTETRGREVFSFNYDERWLAGNDKFLLDPELKFYKGDQYLLDNRPNFGIFLDSAPDRWGRVLMQRREAALAFKENRSRRKLLESDYLLGVHDGQRLGGLRFKTEVDGAFLDNRLDPDLAKEVSIYFGVSNTDANQTIEHFRSMVSNWRAVARKMKIGRAEIEMMEPAFSLAD